MLVSEKGAPAPTPAIVETPQMEAVAPVAEFSLPVETHNSQGKGILFRSCGIVAKGGGSIANPLSVMLRDGSTVVLTEAPGPGLENNVAKQRESSADPPCEEGWSEEELSKLTHFSKVLGMLSKGMKKESDQGCGEESETRFGLPNGDEGERYVSANVIGSEKEEFWEELGAIRGLWEDPWCIGGDFNTVRFPEERRNAPSLTANMRRFSESLHCEKLKALKKDLKNWNREVVGNVSFNRVETFSRLQCWEAKENENPLTPREAEAKKLALEDYKKWALLEETSWRQKSREIG
ncbi:hypothetical protein CK203_018354 [Vitis vinifera]|uniref:Uncharacterized protein n=1 Tax=Vitis vinifera TaxID=29760 RepID=A0A438JPG6_VITVI|nr:hypothetical protein CK203_018354 [Vitis vinifera]